MIASYNSLQPKMEKKKILSIEHRLLLLLLCSFISFNFLSTNPVYLLGLILILISLLEITKTAKINKKTIIIVLFSTLFLISQLIGFFLTKNEFNYELNYLSFILFYFSWLLSVFTPQIISKMRLCGRMYAYRKAINLSIYFLSLELLSRIILYDSNQELLYAFKNSLFYFDSNFAGIVTVSLMSFSCYLRHRFNMQLTHQIYILLFLTILTFSRTAIAAAIVVIAIFSNFKHFRMKSYFTLLFSFLFFGYMLYQYIYLNADYKSIDGSLNSKFYIFSISEHFYSSLPNEIRLFGISMGNTEKFLGIFAHNIYVTFILEFGLIGSLIVISFVFYSLKKTSSYAIVIWLPVFICGISLFSAYSPYIFIINAIILSEELEAKRQLKNHAI